MRVLHVLEHGLPLQSGYTFRPRAILTASEARGSRGGGGHRTPAGATAADTEVVDGITFHRTAPPRRLPPIAGELAEIAAFARRIDRAVAASAAASTRTRGSTR